MRYAFVLTVAEGKRLIARGLLNNPLVQRAIKDGQILLKGGTTVSAVSEALGGPPLYISGRITPGGFRTAAQRNTGPSWLLWRAGQGLALNDTEAVIAAARSMKPHDIVITGANIIDHEGRAALMVGSPLGAERCWVINLLAAEGVPVFIAAGLEKLCPSVPAAVAAASRQTIDCSQGMAVGLLPLSGRLFTELEAVKSLASVKATAIGSGGIDGVEGGTAIVVEGDREEVEKLATIVRAIKGAKTSGTAESLRSCEGGGGHCQDHLGCYLAHPQF